MTIKIIECLGISAANLHAYYLHEVATLYNYLRAHKSNTIFYFSFLKF